MHRTLPIVERLAGETPSEDALNAIRIAVDTGVDCRVDIESFATHATVAISKKLPWQANFTGAPGASMAGTQEYVRGQKDDDTHVDHAINARIKAPQEAPCIQEPPVAQS